MPTPAPSGLGTGASCAHTLHADAPAGTRPSGRPGYPRAGSGRSLRLACPHPHFGRAVRRLPGRDGPCAHAPQGGGPSGLLSDCRRIDRAPTRGRCAAAGSTSVPDRCHTSPRRRRCGSTGSPVVCPIPLECRLRPPSVRNSRRVALEDRPPLKEDPDSEGHRYEGNRDPSCGERHTPAAGKSVCAG